VGITLDDGERAALLDRTRTGILTTLRRDGSPVALPVWFAVDDGDLFVTTPTGSAKLRRIARDSRGSFLVEQGERWAELTALHLDVEITVVEDPAVADRAQKMIDERYADVRLPPEAMPAFLKAVYGNSTILRLHPIGKPLSWDNSKVRLR
jgi:PPOX class probable F420-dependent enzyme